MIVSIGPSHPATHGTIQIFAELDGERILRADVHCGYLHRGFEKECESHTWHNLIPYVDRLNYCSPLINDFAYCDAVERLMGVEITPRTRVPAHAPVGVLAAVRPPHVHRRRLMELGAMTAFLYLVMIRDYMYEHIAALTGARVTHSYGRIGGLASDLPEGWLKRLEEILVQYEDFVGRVHGLVDRNRIFIDRMRDVGVLTTARGARLRLHGPDAALDGRAARPAQGHALPRLRRARLRGARRHQGRQLRPLLRAHARDGRVGAHDPPARGHAARRARSTWTTGAACFPEKTLVYGEIESLINHFKLVMEGPRVPAGEIYVAHEAANGELGFYLVSTGEGVPYKVHVRAPSFVHMGGAHQMLEGYQLADLVPTFGSINMIGGECDR